jgi:hypothetical protein
MFFESTHARHDFPASAVIRPGYLWYKLAAFKNRYINVVHHIDPQVGRVPDAFAAS